MAEAIGITYSGNVTLQRYTNNVLSRKSEGPIEITGLALKPNSTIVERKCLRLGMRGKVRGTLGQVQPSETTFSLNGMTPELFAMMMLGTSVDLSAAGGTVTGEAIADMEHDVWYKLDHENVGSVVIASYAAGTDYEVDTRLGRVRTLSTGTIADLYDASINYSYFGITGKTIKIGTETKVDVLMLGDLQNNETLGYARLRIPKITIQTQNEVTLIAEEYVDVQMQGKTVLLDGEDSDIYLDEGLTYATS